MKRSQRPVALAKMHLMMEMAIKTMPNDISLANRYAALAWRMNTRYRLRMPYEMRSLFCHRCKSFIPPGSRSRVRLGRGRPKSILLTCLYCGYTHRKLICIKTNIR